MILGPSLIINLAQLEYPSVALLAELVYLLYLDGLSSLSVYLTAFRLVWLASPSNWFALTLTCFVKVVCAKICLLIFCVQITSYKLIDKNCKIILFANCFV